MSPEVKAKLAAEMAKIATQEKAKAENAAMAKSCNGARNALRTIGVERKRTVSNYVSCSRVLNPNTYQSGREVITTRHTIHL